MENIPDKVQNGQTSKNVLNSAETLPSTPHSNRLIYAVAVITILLISSLLAFFYFGGSEILFNKTQTTAKTVQSSILIGAILPLTGDSAEYGIPYQKTLRMVQKEINENGGIAGMPIRLLFEDGMCEGPAAENAAKKLVNQDHIKFLIGGTCSSEVLADAPIAQARKVLTFSSSATSPEITKLGRYVFRTAPSDILAGKAAAQYAFTKWHAKTAVVFFEDTNYAMSLGEVFKNNFTNLGGSVVLFEKFDGKQTNFDIEAEKTKNLNPDMVYFVPQSPTPGLLLVSALKSRNVTAKLLTSEILTVRNVIQKQLNIVEGITGVEVYFDQNAPKSKDFLDKYKRTYGIEANEMAFEAGLQDILYLIKEAYEKAGPDPDNQADYLYNLKHWKGASGDISFDKNGDTLSSYSILLISNGKVQPIDIYTPENN